VRRAPTSFVGRVAVKAPIVKLNPQRGAVRGRQFVSAKAVAAHLRHLEHDGVTRDGEKGQVYSAKHDMADGRAFLERECFPTSRI
jgi:type IV secretory pathway VirD2 relaxase